MTIVDRNRAGRAAIAVAGVLAGYLAFARDRQLRWGATDDEVSGDLPGDELLAGADLVATRAVTVAATPKEVWPWIVQLGQSRGGFYSYDVLENLVGCRIHNADRVVSEWQHIAVGDEVRLHPEVALTVAAVSPGRALVLRGGVPMDDVPPPYDFTWAFVVAERPDGTTRLLVRERYAYTRGWAALLVEPVAVISFLMSRKMLRGIRDRAERTSTIGRP
ncbi:SRPBCC family protein [Actinophytocola oryzae]|uniref:Polyketide cyclase/dehydrase/lipid transport protein n=1 Tax=Actinophytocola oryzae TaxID=502181 RepID=A0A4R7V7L0_9PSEU|nr:SRPBCC family protein [Actinophytocola oryzae]TDV44145.1 hypothetical protein CLV71_11454 [Actinophytocola oryzae]